MPNNSLETLIAVETDARNFGFEWQNREMIIDQAISECEEIREAIHKQETDARIQEEIGDLLHTAISLCIFAGYDVDQTLEKISKKFANRMIALKKITKSRGLTNLKGQTMEFMLELWDEVKKGKCDAVN